MNLLSTLSTLNLAANCPENWQAAARERESQTCAGNLASTRMPLEIGGAVREEVGGNADGKIGDSMIPLDDTIVSDCMLTLDRFFSLFSRENSIQNSIDEIFSEIKNYRHNGESERLFVGLNPQQPSGRYGPKPTVP